MDHSFSNSEPQEELPPEEPNTLGTLFSDLTHNVSVLVRQEVELAKAELKESASEVGKSAGMFAGAGIAAHFVLLFLSIGAWAGLSHWVDQGWAALIIALVWAVIALVLAVIARRKIKEVKGLPQTTETVKKIPSAFTSKEEHP